MVIITGLTGELNTCDSTYNWIDFRTYILVMVIITGFTGELNTCDGTYNWINFRT